MESKKSNVIESAGTWIRSSVTLKLFAVMVLALALIIPTSMIKSLISERQSIREEAIQEVRSKWANDQTIQGPVLTIPYIRQVLKDGTFIREVDYAYFLPDELTITGEVLSKELRRGIYEIVVYDSELSVMGSYDPVSFPPIEDLVEINWDKAHLTLGISDMRGIKDNFQIVIDGKEYPVNPGSMAPTIASGVSVGLDREVFESGYGKFNFAASMNLQGSKRLYFIPAGKTSTVNLKSNWPDPSFDGAFLPKERNVAKDGFAATWKVLQVNRNFPQFWTGNLDPKMIQSSSFGVHLFVPADDYQKTMRSAKYALMTIALTFLLFFLVEIMNGRKIHPFQYTLVGLALCLFYTLLISISEHSNFNMAYGISVLVVSGLIFGYSISIFKSIRLSLILTAVLLASYGFVFVTLQLSDYALLLGSVGMTMVLALTMYLTRDIDWYGLSAPSQE